MAGQKTPGFMAPITANCPARTARKMAACDERTMHVILLLGLCMTVYGLKTVRNTSPFKYFLKILQEIAESLLEKQSC